MNLANYENNVFINCPFDDEYVELRNAMLFAIYDCGFIPRCALEENNSGNVRFEKINRLIKDSKFGIHDISRTELDDENSLPRFNMPLELGVFLGAKMFGNGLQKSKNCLIVDTKRYRYQKFISDISGHDIKDHNNEPNKLIALIRNWLSTVSHRTTIPGGKKIIERYTLFKQDLPEICNNANVTPDELTYNDYSSFISVWLKKISST